MGCKGQMEKLVATLRELIDSKRYEVLAVFIANYGPKLVDTGADFDRLYEENLRLSTIVNLIEMQAERDALRKRVAELENGNG